MMVMCSTELLWFDVQRIMPPFRQAPRSFYDSNDSSLDGFQVKLVIGKFISSSLI